MRLSELDGLESHFEIATRIDAEMGQRPYTLTELVSELILAQRQQEQERGEILLQLSNLRRVAQEIIGVVRRLRQRQGRIPPYRASEKGILARALGAQRHELRELIRPAEVILCHDPRNHGKAAHTCDPPPAWKIFDREPEKETE
jgi:hypothetical protein